ncbi:conserved exported protein of unknown function [Bradyrhizobium sp. ORS 285]|uniref:hypothetical protein n=1 Tax=Bradyrhizobium sp. ORS 285 TaxID=115808 RepID=UPI0002405C42|nr:hypothetical protein [Bradyrhizobium sp. ORS 285]CCD87137.1 conserved exported hypothetical protein [Bradyrhizobium sp. ORS 285]SMX60166.1 conserved exported protein of unknown function [Bradyrhizobium sp. ORS 285]
MLRRIALFAVAAAAAITMLAASAAPSAALDLSWVSNKGYVQCLNYASAHSRYYPPGYQREADYDKMQRACNRGYYPNRPGVQY